MMPMVQQMMSNPQAMQQMHQMMGGGATPGTDGGDALGGMMQQVMNNPQMMQQMMPMAQQMMSNPQMMQQMMQMRQSMGIDMPGGGMFGNLGLPPVGAAPAVANGPAA